MSDGLRVAITADLHWGHRKGQVATRKLADHLHHHPPDVLLLGGDIGVGPQFEDCLRLFADLNCPRAVVAGNHDLWVIPEGSDHDSLDLFERLLPRVSASQGFQYLDKGPLFLPGANLAVVGTVNWYDYSWSFDQLRQSFPEELERLQSKRFTRGRHNDAHFIRWPLDDAGFTALVTALLEQHLLSALGQVSNLLILTHHPPIYDLGFPRLAPPTDLDSLLWDAFCGNVGVEQLLARHAEHIRFAFCGHTHRARETVWEGIRGYNIGGDYPFKRLLQLDWPRGTVSALEFTDD